ncbi:MAG: hypothetical protein LUD02_11075 [Tannerellaceae bacterium]|nr:hypothetical protein [Tannerellaceae bacterium]
MNSEQKVKDFEYLYNTLKENYPYFGIAKRKHGTDWLAKKDEYLTLIANTTNDSAYITTLNFILRELRNGHTDLFPTSHWEEYAKVYKTGALIRPIYSTCADIVEDPVARPHYWSKLLNEGTSGNAGVVSSEKRS